MPSSQAKQKAARVSLIGSDTLLGREVEEVLKNRDLGVTVRQFAGNAEGNFSDQEGEAVYLEPLTPETVRDDRAIIIAGTEVGSLKAYEIAKAAGGNPPVIDCTGYLEHMPDARIVAPLMEDFSGRTNWLLEIAHPAAGVIGLVLTRLNRYRPVRQSIIHVFEPASERGKSGVAELHQQTTSLFSFKPMEKNVFDAQVSFNLLSQYGEEAPSKLVDVEQRIEKHVATLLGRRANGKSVVMPSLRLIQSPVFHGYSFSAWVEFDADIRAGEIGEALASAQIEVRQQSDAAPDSIAAAGQSGLIAGDIRLDPNHPRAAWIWIVADNLRLMADAAVDLVAEFGGLQ